MAHSIGLTLDLSLPLHIRYSLIRDSAGDCKVPGGSLEWTEVSIESVHLGPLDLTIHLSSDQLQMISEAVSEELDP